MWDSEKWNGIGASEEDAPAGSWVEGLDAQHFLAGLRHDDQWGGDEPQTIVGSQLSKLTQPRLWVVNKTISENFDLRGFHQKAEVVFERCTFTETVTGGGAKYHGRWLFVRCDFQRSISLADAEFEHGLAFAGCRFGFPEEPTDLKSFESHADFHEPPSRKTSVWLPGLRVSGALRFDRCCVAGSLNLANARIDGTLLMRGMHVGTKKRPGGRFRGRLHLFHVHVAGDVDLSPHVVTRAVHDGRLRTRVWGSVVLSSAQIDGRVDLRGSWIQNRLHLPMARIRDRLCAEVWLHSDDRDKEHVVRTMIGQREGVAVRMADAKIEAGVWFDGAWLSGQLDAQNVEVGGDFTMEQATDRERKPFAGPAIVALQEVGETGIKECVRMAGAQIYGRLDLDWLVTRGQINLESCRIEGEARMRGATILAPDPGDGPALKLKTAHFGRSLDLRGTVVDFGPQRTARDNRRAIEAHDVEVEGDMCLGIWDRKLSGEYPGYARDVAGRWRWLLEGSQALLASDEKARTAWLGGRINGLIDLTNSHVKGELLLGGALINGKLAAQGIRVDHVCDLSGGVFFGEVDFDDARVDGEFLIGCECDHQSRAAQGTEEFTKLGTVFADRLTLRRAEIAGDLLYAAVFFGGVSGETDLLSALHGREALERARRALQATHTGAKSALNLRLATIKGSIFQPRERDGAPKAPSPSAIDALLNSMAPPSNSPKVVSSSRPEAENWLAKHAPHSCFHVRCFGGVHATNVRVLGDVSLVAWRVSQGGVEFEGASIGDDFVLAHSLIAGDFDGGGVRISSEAFWPLDVRIKGCSGALDRIVIGGEVRLQQAAISSFTFRFHVSDEKQFLPRKLNIAHAKIGRLEISGEISPFKAVDSLEFDLEGLEIAEFDFHGLKFAVPPGMATEAGFVSCGLPQTYWIRRYFYFAPLRIVFWTLPSLLLGFVLSRPLAAVPAGVVVALGWGDPARLTYLVAGALVLGLMIALHVAQFGWQALSGCWRCFRLFERPGLPPWYPEHELLFLAMMRVCDNGLYARIEQQLASSGERVRAEKVYLERRIAGLESGVLAMFWHLAQGVGKPRASSGRHAVELTAAGRRAFQNPLILEAKAREHFATRRSYRFGILRGRRWLVLARNRFAPRIFRAGFWRKALGSEFWQELLSGEFWQELFVRLFSGHKRFVSRLLLLSVGDGVRPMPLLVMSLVLFSFSWLVIFKEPDSVEHPATYVVMRTSFDAAVPKPAAEAHATWRALPEPVFGQSGSAKELGNWGVLDSFWVALDVHLPLVRLFGRDDWQPSDQNIVVFGQKVPIRADTWGGWMQIFGWISVPVLLSALTGLLKRRAA